MMKRVLPDIQVVSVPLDDIIHRIPYQIPYVPYVTPHGGTEALGWKVGDRWVCYYAPGDLGTAWGEDYGGVSEEVQEAALQLGTNVIFYSHENVRKKDSHKLRENIERPSFHE